MNAGYRLFALLLVLGPISPSIKIQESRANFRRAIAVPSCGPVCAPYTIERPTVVKEVIKEVVKEVPLAVVSPYPVIATQTVAVPVYSYVNAPGYIPGATYGSVLQGHQSAEQDANRIADIVLQKLEQRLRLPQQNQLSPNQNNSSDGSGPPAVRNSVQGAGKGEGVLQSRCAACHSGGSPASGLSFIEGGRVKQVSADTRIAIYDAVYEGRMPPPKTGGQPLSDQEVDSVRVWMKQRQR